MSIITIGASSEKSFNAYLSTPPGGAGHGIVVIQEIFGVDEGLRATTDELGRKGFVALAPDLFWRLEPDPELEGRTEEEGRRLRQQFDWPAAISDLEKCVAYLRKHPQSSGRVGTIGFCMGGTLAFMMSISGSADCDVSIHGVGLERLVDGAVGIEHPLQVHIGEHDRLVPPEAREKIVRGLEKHPLAEVYVYPGAEHGYARPSGRNFDRKASDLTMSRVTDFLSRTLGLTDRRQ
jgi:carboxymethylenebutenolidase